MTSQFFAYTEREEAFRGEPILPIQQLPSTPSLVPQEDEKWEDPEKITEELRLEISDVAIIPEVAELAVKNWHEVRSHQAKSGDVVRYFFRQIGYKPATLPDAVKIIFKESSSAFKILHITVGGVMKNVETSELRFHYTSNNFSIFDYPSPIHDDDSLAKLLDSLQAVDFGEGMNKQRPDTKWQVLEVTHFLIKIIRIKNFTIGCSLVKLPNYIKLNRNLANMLYDKNRRLFKDEGCIFRCISQQKYGNYSPRNVLKVYMNFSNFTRLDVAFENYPGFNLSQIAQLEDCFKLNIQLFSLNPSQNSNSPRTAYHVICVRHSSGKYSDTLNLDLQIDGSLAHVSFIKNFNSYAKKLQCSGCAKMFKRLDKLKRHQKSGCTEGKPTHKFPGGRWTERMTVFEALDELGIKISQEKRFYPWKMCVDFESLLHPLDGAEKLKRIPGACQVVDEALHRLGIQHEANEEGQKLHWTHEHIPVSFALSSNIEGEGPGYDSQGAYVCINSSPQALVRDLMTKVNEISNNNYMRLMEEEWEYQSALQLLDQMVLEAENVDDECKGKKHHRQYRNRLQSVRSSFKLWMHQVPLLGFNLGKYDLNLIKTFLFDYLINQQDYDTEGDGDAGEEAESYIDDAAESEEEEDEKTTKTPRWPRVIKRGNRYIAISTPKLRILDVSLYCAAGTSLDSFLQIWGQELRKIPFPYSYLDKLEKLHEKQLPPIEAFRDYMSGKSISQSQYESCQKIWKENAMETFEDYLKVGVLLLDFTTSRSFSVLQCQRCSTFPGFVHQTG
jgi:hypothetical protein